eukprot:16975-Heterococcus_DN1.PRE.2
MQACAEAMSMTYGLTGQKRQKFFVSSDVHPQSIALVQTRGSAIGLDIVVGDAEKVDFTGDDYCGALIQYPTTFGVVNDYAAFTERAHANKVSYFTMHNMLQQQPTLIVQGCLCVLGNIALYSNLCFDHVAVASQCRLVPVVQFESATAI